MRTKVTILFVCGFLVTATAAWLFFTNSQRGRLRLSVQFVGYTNTTYGMHVGVLQVSNASPFAVVRGRSPAVVSDSPAAPVSYTPTGLNVLKPGESERVMSEPLTNGVRWRFVVTGQRIGGDSYGLAPEPRFWVWMRQVAFWLREHRVRVRTPSPPPGHEFSSNWIEP